MHSSQTGVIASGNARIKIRGQITTTGPNAVGVVASGSSQVNVGGGNNVGVIVRDQATVSIEGNPSDAGGSHAQFSRTTGTLFHQSQPQTPQVTISGDVHGAVVASGNTSLEITGDVICSRR